MLGRVPWMNGRGQPLVVKKSESDFSAEFQGAVTIIEAALVCYGALLKAAY